MSLTGPLVPSISPQMTLTFAPSRQRHLRYLVIGEPAVPGVHHLVGRREVGPQLKAAHGALFVALRHLLVDDAAAGRHPLDVAAADDAVISHAVAMLDLPVEHIRDGFDPSMRVPGKPLQIEARVVGAKIVEKEEGVEVRDLVRSRRPASGGRRPPR